MTIETLKERIEKANAKVERKQNTIAKKTAAIAKKSAMLKNKYGIDAETFDKYNRDGYDEEARYEIFNVMCDIDYLKEDIKRGAREIEETKATIEKYEKQLAGEIEKDEIIIREVPESIKEMQNELVRRWDEFDKGSREAYRKAYREMGYKEFVHQYKYAGYQFMYITDEEIHSANEKNAKRLVIDLYNRVRGITGEITSWANVRTEQGAHGMIVLNGYVEGKEGRAEIESILAGGYNIQRLHVRVLVKEYR